MIDSGVDPSNTLANAWVVAREVFVPAHERNFEHGTFVAGLLAHGRLLNHDDARFPQASCKIVDVVALPRTNRIGEDDLLAILGEVIPKYADVRVWNLSLASSIPCSDHAFSDLAIALDELQSRFNVTCILAAGNYTTAPYRDWPVTVPLGEDADASNLFDSSFKRPDLIECGCNMHARRYFVKALDAGDTRAALPIAAYKKIYDIESELAGLDVDEKLTARKARSKPVFEELGAWCRVYKPSEPPSSLLGEAFGTSPTTKSHSRGSSRPERFPSTTALSNGCTCVRPSRERTSSSPARMLVAFARPSHSQFSPAV